MAEGELCVEASQAFASPLEPRLVGQLSPAPGRLQDLDHIDSHLGHLHNDDDDDDHGHL